MPQLGLGVMINMLGGNEESIEALRNGMGKEIAALFLGEDFVLHFVFADGYKMGILDAGQSCCESRWMSTDDDLPYYVGTFLQDIRIQDGPDIPSSEEHQTQFLKITTSKGVFTMVTHVEHNGYYGGFSVVARKE